MGEYSRKLAVLLHADVVSSTALVQKNEAVAHDRIQQVFRRFSETISRYGGIAHEVRGDALVAEFGRASDSVCAALAFQAENIAHNNELKDEIRPEVRIGISLGEVVVADGTITGPGVVLSQRLEQLATSNGVVVQGTVSETVPIRLPFDFDTLGEQTLKGFDQPIRAFVVRVKHGELVPAPESDTTTKHEGSEQQVPSDPGKPSIAVLPFDNMSEDPDQEYFSDGITEDIITDLSKVRSIFVVARNSTFTYKGRSVKTQEVCADLGVRYVVEGSVRKAGNRVRITAQLIDGSTDGHVWADRYDGTLEDIFELQDEVTCQIVNALKMRLLPEEKQAIQKVPTVSIEAYDLYLKGRQHFHYGSKENLHKAQDYFSRAIQCDDSYAQPYSGLADCSSFLATEHGGGRASLVDAMGAAGKAIELAPDLAEGHASLGLLLSTTGEYSGAEEEFEVAVDLDPNLFEAHYYWARTCFAQGKLKEAADHFETAWKRSPGDPQTPSLLLQVYRSLGRKEDMEDAAQETVKAALQKLESEPDNWRAHLSLAFGYLNLGQFSDVGSVLERVLINNRDDSIVNYNVACLYCGMGETESALRHLEVSLVKGKGTQFLAWIENDSDLDLLRNDPRFQELLQRSLVNG